jgi:hypothetical protein
MMRFEAELSWDNGMTISNVVREFKAPSRMAALEKVGEFRDEGKSVRSLKRVIPIKLP